MNWWRGMTRIAAVLSAAWGVGVGILAIGNWSDIVAPAADERALASLAGCAPERVNTKGLFTDPLYTGFSAEDKLDILGKLCPSSRGVYTNLSGWGKERLLRGVGIWPQVRVSGITAGRAETLHRSFKFAGLGVTPPALLYMLLFAARWVLRGFRGEA